MSFPTSAVAAAGYLFSQSVTVFERDVTINSGGEVDNTQFPNRQITGVIQPFSELDISIGDDGAISNKGFLLLHTTYELFVFDGTLTAGSNLQSYAIYEGREWKVNKQEDWRDKTSGFNRYILSTFVDRGTI